jgi:hypothetical protein
VTQLRDELHQITEANAQLVVVGNGKPHQAAAFIEDEKLNFPVFVDPDLVAYKLAGLRRDLASTLKLSALGNAMRAMKGGHMQTGLKGDAWQQGGVFVIQQPENSVSMAYVSEAAGDHPSIEGIISSIKQN